MRIIVFGASGDVGSRVVAEALNRGHIVTAVLRRPEQRALLPDGAVPLVAEIRQAEDVPPLLAGQDYLISALRPPAGLENQLEPLTGAVLDGAAAARIPVLIVGGAARLEIPAQNGDTVLTAPGFLPDAVHPIARASQTQYERCLNEDTAAWSCASPPAMLLPGTRTGQYRRGTDHLLFDANGESKISMEDFAVALVDAAEAPPKRGTRFTVAGADSDWHGAGP